MINPPTEENTGFSAEQIKNVMYGYAQKLADGYESKSELKAYINQLVNGTARASQPRIKVDIDGKTVMRKLMFDAASLDEPIYNIYYLTDEKKEATKEFLTDKFGQRYYLDFRDVKAALKVQNAE